MKRISLNLILNLNLYLILFLALSAMCSTPASGETSYGWLTLLPRERYVPAFSANPTAHQFSTGEILKNRNVSTSMGGIFPLVNVRSGWLDAQLSVGSSVYAWLDPPGAVNLISADFAVDFVIIDLPLTDRLTLRIAPGHTSHHLSDNSYETSGLTKSLNYVRDYWDAFAIYRSEELKGFVYGGAFYHYTFQIDREVNKPWLFEMGGEFLQTRIGDGMVAYAGADVKFRQESGFGSTQNYQVGVRLINGRDYSVRFAVNYRTGLDDRGQFTGQRNRFVMVAAYIDV